MAHRDFSNVCPIFEEGVEKEVALEFKTCTTLSTNYGPIDYIPWGREVEIVEVYARMYTSTTISTNGSCRVGLFADLSCSTTIGSIDFSAAVVSEKAGAAYTSGDMTTSLSFTSTDYIGAALFQESSSGNTMRVFVRYRDK